jgi:hypothetical protein
MCTTKQRISNALFDIVIAHYLGIFLMQLNLLHKVLLDLIGMR